MMYSAHPPPLNQAPGAFPGGGGMDVPSILVELSLSCNKLVDKDTFSKSDPFCVIYMSNSVQGKYLEIARTETIWDNLNPVWQKKLVIPYRFEEKQKMKFDIYDQDSKSKALDAQDFLGSLEITLGEIMASQSRGFTRPLKDGGKGTITIVAEELMESREQITLDFSARKLDKMDWFGKSDPFLEIHKVTEANSKILVHRTEPIKKTLNPNWKPIKIFMRDLCNCDDDRTLRFEVYDWNRSGSHDLIGGFDSTLRKLRNGPGSDNEYNVINKEKQRKKGAKYKNSGTVILNKFFSETPPSFLDYIRGGTEMNFTVAVDFTGSNGNPDDPRSLHYRGASNTPNHYVTAIQAVGGIIQDYDFDKQFPALGFGARIPPDFSVSHEFFMNLSTESPYCAGIEGVISAYYTAINNVKLYGPTNFSPVIRHISKFAHAYQNDPKNYFVLLIITDGVITDLEDTKNAIIDASSLPLSIIIVGVGSEDFSAMDELDSDDELLSCYGRTAKRDIVQFVELQKFLGPNGGWDKASLAKEVLEEIPDQLLGYMKSKGFAPPVPNASAPPVRSPM